jgi:hypothetical protein
MRYFTKVRLAVAAAGLGFLVAGGHTAHGQEAPATQPTVPPVFTEDFESGTLNKDIWTPKLNAGATVTVEQDVVAHGKNALLVHYPAANGAYGFITTKGLPDSLKSHFFGRAYVMFPKAPPNHHDVFITAGNEGWPTANFLEIGQRQNKAQLSYQQNAKGATRGETMIPGPAYPIGKWFCLEWEFNDSPDTITIWIDGEKVTDKPVGFKGTSDHLVKGFDEFGFGFRVWGAAPGGFDLYYDDIAIGTGRIGPVK